MKLKDLLFEGTLTSAAKKCIQVVTSKFGRSSFPSIGTYNYRTIANSNTLSEHAYGNAVDFHVPSIKIPGNYDTATPDGKILGDRVKDFLLENTERLEIQDLIWYNEIWSRSNNFIKRSYGGAHPHEDHVHVDFLRPGRGNYNAVKRININQKNNKYIVDLIMSYYYISSTEQGAEEYFGKFKSWNPLSPGIGDDEEGAADKLTSRFEKIYEPELKRIENDKSTSREDKENIQYIRQIITTLSDAILNGKSVSFDIVYNKYDATTKSYVNKTKSFDWNYM